MVDNLSFTSTSLSRLGTAADKLQRRIALASSVIILVSVIRYRHRTIGHEMLTTDNQYPLATGPCGIHLLNRSDACVGDNHLPLELTQFSVVLARPRSQLNHALRSDVDLLLGRPPDQGWRHRLGRPRNRWPWLDQLCGDNNVSPADLWRRAVSRGQSSVTLRSSSTTRMLNDNDIADKKLSCCRETARCSTLSRNASLHIENATKVA